jgi:hypothetical protein
MYASRPAIAAAADRTLRRVGEVRTITRCARSATWPSETALERSDPA